MKSAGLYTQFEERGASIGYWSGDVLHNWTQYDSYVGTTVSQEVTSRTADYESYGGEHYHL